MKIDRVKTRQPSYLSTLMSMISRMYRAADMTRSQTKSVEKGDNHVQSREEY
jgi:hypothetical protein